MMSVVYAASYNGHYYADYFANAKFPDALGLKGTECFWLVPQVGYDT